MIYNIQALRALAAAIVLVVHLPPLLWPLGLGRKAFAFGNVGVDLFFVISGFVMVHTIRRRPLSGAAFIANRIIRVAPLYWLLTLAVFAIALAMPSLLGTTRADWADLAGSLAFIPYEKEAGAALPVLFVGWTLNYEMAFYAVFALMLALGRRSLAATILGTTAVLLALVVVGMVVRPTGVVAHFYTMPIMTEFAFGMLIGWAQAGWRRVPVLPAALIAAAGLGFWLVGAALWPTWPRQIVSGLPAALVVAMAVALEQKGAVVLRGARIQLLGAASYALYLTHPFVLQAVAKVSAKLGAPLLAYALVPVAIVAAVVVAVLVHKCVESPMTDWLRRRTHRPPPIVEQAEPPLDALIGDGVTNRA